MLIMFDTPEGVDSEAARDLVIQTLDAIAEKVHQGHTFGEIQNPNGARIGTWVIAQSSEPLAVSDANCRVLRHFDTRRKSA